MSIATDMGNPFDMLKTVEATETSRLANQKAGLLIPYVQQREESEIGQNESAARYNNATANRSEALLELDVTSKQLDNQDKTQKYMELLRDSKARGTTMELQRITDRYSIDRFNEDPEAFYAQLHTLEALQKGEADALTLENQSNQTYMASNILRGTFENGGLQAVAMASNELKQKYPLASIPQFKTDAEVNGWLGRSKYLLDTAKTAQAYNLDNHQLQNDIKLENMKQKYRLDLAKIEASGSVNTTASPTEGEITNVTNVLKNHPKLSKISDLDPNFMVAAVKIASMAKVMADNKGGNLMNYVDDLADIFADEYFTEGEDGYFGGLVFGLGGKRATLDLNKGRDSAEYDDNIQSRFDSEASIPEGAVLGKKTPKGYEVILKGKVTGYFE